MLYEVHKVERFANSLMRHLAIETKIKLKFNYNNFNDLSLETKEGKIGRAHV